MLFRTVFLALALSSTVLATPSHHARSVPLNGGILQRHNRLAARVAEPLAHTGSQRRSARKGRRDLTRRQCKQRETTTSSTFVPETTPTAAFVAEEMTSTVEEPEPTSTTEPEPAPITTEASHETPPEPPAADPAPTESSPEGDNSGGGGGGGETFTAQLTYYATGLGACGITNTDTDYICAVSTELFDTYPGYTGQNPNNNPLCGKQINLTYGGKTVTVQVTDRCEACAFWDLDLSPTVFGTLADFALGRLSDATWQWA